MLRYRYFDINAKSTTQKYGEIIPATSVFVRNVCHIFPRAVFRKCIIKKTDKKKGWQLKLPSFPYNKNTKSTLSSDKHDNYTIFRKKSIKLIDHFR